MPWIAPVSPCGLQKIPKKILNFFWCLHALGALVTPRGSQKKIPKTFFEIFFNTLEVSTCPG